MMRSVKKYQCSLTDESKKQFLLWAQQFDEVIWLDSNHYSQKYQSFDAILAVDAFTAIKTDTHGAFEKLREYQTSMEDWLFGYLSYDLKNDVEPLQSNNFDGLDFPDLYFFQPKKIFVFLQDTVEFHYLNVVADEMDRDWKEIFQTTTVANASRIFSPLKICARTSKDAYFKKVHLTLDHIRRGDIYEANICQEFYAENAQIDPLGTFLNLNEISKSPFAVFLKLQDLFALSASPERYLKKTGNKLISQPIKGTARRLTNKKADLEGAQRLKNDPKERSENIMITDLVRNDLSRLAEKGSVLVEELCEIYTFQQVHQLISTVSCAVGPDVSKVAMLQNTFPMGSMTGAPKISAMKIIEELEDAKRGLYSGAIGYFSPSGDFDFNVVIRSILYNEARKYVSFSVGSAITVNSIPEKEYEECLIKSGAMREVLAKG
jgi:para-aminobenzoate synthetase component 1